MERAFLEGDTFGDLQVIRFSKVDKWGSATWECLCKCGETTYVRTGSLYSGNTTKCKRCAKAKHRMFETKIYGVWQGMKTRCSNPKSINYHNYGGRGISYDPRWESFTDFYEDMGAGYKEGLTLDRKDNDLGYSKDNCEWVTPERQGLNQRTNSLFLHNGKTKTATELSKELNIRRRVLYSLRSYHKDWADEQVIEEAIRRTNLDRR